MKISCALASLVLALADGSLLAAETQQSPQPLIRAHAHNDYEHTRPLLDALNNGFCSVEADVYLVDGKLLVAHDLPKVSPDRTLQSLYLAPLRARSRQNDGRIYPKGPPIILLIDIKSEAESTYATLKGVLQDYSDLVSSYSNEGKTQRAVDVIISGNRPRQTMTTEAVRYAALDGRINDLDTKVAPGLMPLISDNWNNFFKWRGNGPFPENEKALLKSLVGKAHQQGYKIRFWATADHLPVWQELFTAGVDLINTDKLSDLSLFLLEKSPEKNAAR